MNNGNGNLTPLGYPYGNYVDQTCVPCGVSCPAPVSTVQNLGELNPLDFADARQCQYQFNLTIPASSTGSYVFGFDISNLTAAERQLHIDNIYAATNAGTAPTLAAVWPANLILANGVTGHQNWWQLCGLTILRSASDSLTYELRSVSFDPTLQGFCSQIDLEEVCPPCPNTNSNFNFTGFDVSNKIISYTSALVLTITNTSDAAATVRWTGGIARFGVPTSFQNCANGVNAYRVGM